MGTAVDGLVALALGIHAAVERNAMVVGIVWMIVHHQIAGLVLRQNVVLQQVVTIGVVLVMQQ